MAKLLTGSLMFSRFFFPNSMDYFRWSFGALMYDMLTGAVSEEKYPCRSMESQEKECIVLASVYG